MPDPTVAPLAVLAETWPVRDALILTFNANLGFFERAALARLRARGARVTLVSDADMVHADPHAVRFAGRAYLDGRAVCRGGGAFHPKLIVIVSDTKAAVLIGSGNASPGGWVDNAELWTLLRATGDEGPSSLSRIGDFLDGLAEYVTFTPGVVPVLEEVASTLRAFRATEEGPTVVSTVWGPIIDQLPVGEASELVIATPFFDRNAEATRRLHERFSAKAVDVLVQPASVYDGPRLAATLESIGGTVSTILDKRYHHGKLIEWRTEDGIVSLTGSANASGAALLRGMAQHANCELGLVASTPESLRPPTGDPSSPATVAAHEWVEAPETGGQRAVALLAAVLEADGLRLILRRPLEVPAQLEYLADTTWVAVDAVPVGVGEFTAATVLPGASAVRLLFADGTPSAVVWVTELARTNFRHVAARRSLPNDPTELPLDPRLITMVETALATVRAWSSATAPPGTAALGVHRPQEGSRESWRDYIDGFRAEVGDGFSFFVLPTLMRGIGIEEPEAPVGEPGPDGEEPPTPEETLLARLDAMHNDSKTAERLKSYRRMCEKLNANLAGRPQPVRIAATTLTVSGGALGCWKDKQEFAVELRRSIRQLAVLAAEEEWREDAANIAAVALTILEHHARAAKAGSVGDEAGVTYRAAVQEARKLVAHATHEGVAERSAGLVAAVFGRVVEAGKVMSTVGAATEPDHVEAAAETLEVEHGLEAQVDGNRITITTELTSDPAKLALRAIGLASAAPAVGVVARNATTTAAAAWRKPDLVVVYRTPKGRRVTHSKLTGTLSPADHLHSEGRIPTRFEKGNWYDSNPVPAEVEEVLLEADLLLEEL